MNFRRWLMLVGGLLLLLAAIIFIDPSRRALGLIRGEAFFNERPASIWANSLSSDNPATQAEAVNTLREGKGDAVPVLIDVIRRNPGPDARAVKIRTECLSLLSQSGQGDEVVGDVLVQLLTDVEPNLRGVSANAIATLKTPPPPRALPTLILMLDTKQKLPATLALAKYGKDAKGAIPGLRKLLADEDIDVRAKAAKAVGKIGPDAKEVVPDLIKQLDDPAPKVREHAAEALGDIGPDSKEAIPHLARMLKDPDAKVRRDSVRSLGQVGPDAKAVIPQILPLLDDPQDLVKEATRTTLKILDPNISLEPKK